MERSKQSAIVCIAVLSLCTLASGKIIYVDDDANGLGNGSSWQTAYKYLQDALADAKAAEKPVEIRVAQGVYRPDRTWAKPTGTRDREATFHLIDQVTLKAGFAGIGVVDPNARDVGLYKTILSGDLAGNDVELANPLNARGSPTRADNCYHVVSYNESHTLSGHLTTELDGFIVTGGYAFTRKLAGPEEFTQPIHVGGGMYVRAASRVTVRDCTFEGNYAEEGAGGASLSYISHQTLERCTFIRNVGYWGAGGLSCGGDDAMLSSCRFERNQGKGAGGAGLGGKHVLLTDCSFSWNVAQHGAGLYSGGTVKLVNCVLRGNVASGSGGAILLYAGTIETVGCEFLDNTAAYGGAILVNDSSGLTTLNDSVFAGNTAHRTGGAIWMNMSEVHLLNCTASGNRAPQGRFIRADTPADTGIYPRGSVDIVNCIISDDGDEIWNNHGAITIRYTDFLGGRTAVHDPNATITWGDGNIDADPCFADLGYWDPNGTADDPNDDFWVEGDYHLKSLAGRWDPNEQRWVADDVSSPCIDAGDPNSPMGDEPEPNGGRINMGVYGGTSEASMSYFDEQDVVGDVRSFFFILP